MEHADVMTLPKIVLASQSPRRAMLLRRWGLPFEVVPSRAEEKDAKAHNVAQIVEENARIKGAEVASRPANGESELNGSIVVAADTLVAMGEKVYGKPVDLDEAERFLTELGGKTHQVLTGVYLHNLISGQTHLFHVVTGVRLKRMDGRELRRLFGRVDPLDKAAGYGFQDDRSIVERLEGSQTNVMGLPMERLAEALARSSGCPLPPWQDF